MRHPHTLLLVTLGFLVASCSEKSSRDRDKREDAKERRAESAETEGKERSSPEEEEDAERRELEVSPETQDIGEDCVAFLRATKAVPPGREGKECPECPPGNSTVEVLQFEGYKIERIVPSTDGCSVTVEIRAKFNPGAGGKITGGLVGWIPLEQREQYVRGQAPEGSQLYRVIVTYRREDRTWRAIEFARSGGE